MKRDDLKIPSPCTADWSTMTGDTQRRFCDHCQKHVHNLSAMTAPEARAVLAEPKVCVRYATRPDGEIQHAPASRRALLRRGAMAAGLLALSLPAAAAMSTAETGTACAPPGLMTRLWSAVFGEATVEPLMGEPMPVLMGAPMPIEPDPVELVEIEMGKIEAVFPDEVPPAEDEGTEE